MKYKHEHRWEHKKVQKINSELKLKFQMFFLTVIASFSEVATAIDTFGVAEQVY